MFMQVMGLCRSFKIQENKIYAELNEGSQRCTAGGKD